MRKITQIFLFLVCTLLFSCSDRVSVNEGSSVPRKCETISLETSVLIAKGELFLDYDLKSYEVSVESRENFWEVHFISTCETCHGGNPYVRVDKASGRVLEAVTPK